MLICYARIKQIGNGIMNDETDYCGYIDYLWSHALTSDEDYESSRCKSKNESTGINGNSLAAHVGSPTIIDYYNIYAPLCPGHPDAIWPSSISTVKLSLKYFIFYKFSSIF